MVKEILKLGDPQLYEVSDPITLSDMPHVREWVADLHDTLMEYDKPYVFINPLMEFPDDEMYELLDDCMSFPGLIVRVRRYCRAKIRYLDLDLQQKEMELEGDLSELLQHEYDHLDGILATMRAVDNKSLILSQMKREF